MARVNGFESGVTPYETYQNNLKKWRARFKELKRIATFIAWVRLFVFIAIFGVPAIITLQYPYFFYLSISTFVGLLLFLINYSGRINFKHNYAYQRIQFLEKELNVLNNKWFDYSEGEEYIEPDHDYAHDLDLFGKGSLFQYLNRTVLVGGKNQLAYALKHLSLDKMAIINKQEAIAELADNLEFRSNFYALGAIAEATNKKGVEPDIRQGIDFSFVSRTMSFVIRVFPIITLLLFFLSIIGVIDASLIGLQFILGLLISGAYLNSTNKAHHLVTSLGKLLDQYAKIIYHIEEHRFTSSKMNEIQSQIQSNGVKASRVLKELSVLINLFDQRLNMIVAFLFNGLFLSDLNIVLALKQWYKRYDDHLADWFKALYITDSLCSFSSFKYNNPSYQIPTINEQIIFRAKDLGHPLISSESRISNCFEINSLNRICVITGANMAGKSTFLRTIGVNLVLASNGSVVAGTALDYRPMAFITNMRAIDNLMKHESYFFSELKRLQMIVERLKEKGELFFILDEILKGTNSHDKSNGSKELIKQLLKNNGYGLIATHDLELGELAGQFPKAIFNRCFEVIFEGDKLKFDFKLREGVTHSHNASFLMEKMGLIPHKL